MILPYLRGRTDYMRHYQGGHISLCGYTDADRDGDSDEHKSTSGYVFLLNSVVISCTSKKQPCTAFSIMYSEYIACLEAFQEAV